MTRPLYVGDGLTLEEAFANAVEKARLISGWQVLFWRQVSIGGSLNSEGILSYRVIIELLTPNPERQVTQ